MIRITPFGGCGLHNPLAQLVRRKLAPNFFREIGFRHTPFALSANANLQLIDFATGQITIPPWIRQLTYVDADHQPNMLQAKRMFSGELAMVEMSTPIEYMFEGYVLNINRFEEVLLNQLTQLKAEKKLISTWRSSLLKGREEIRKESAQALFALIPKDTEASRNLATFVQGTTTRILTTEEMTNSMGLLRERLDIPVGMVLHNFQFMPDGRPVSWPSDFKDNCEGLAKKLNMPTLDFAELVQKEGVARVMAEDRRHWEPDYFPRLSEMMYDFCARILDRPSANELAEKLAVAVRKKRAEIAIISSPPMNRELDKTPKLVKASSREYLFDHRSGGHMPADENAIYMIVILGQSWALGANGDIEGDTAVSSKPAHPGKALMFDLGLRPRTRTVKCFVDLHERSSGSTKETVSSGIADHVLRNCEQRFGKKPKLLFVVVGRGGTNVTGVGMTPDDGLLRGSVQHCEVMDLVAKARDIALKQSARLEVAAICLLQGENEAGRKANPVDYRRSLSLLQSSYDSDIRRLTGQDEAVRLYLTQTNRGSFRTEAPEIPMAQLRVQDDNALIRCVGPTYFAPPEVRESGTASHAKAIGYRRIGHMFGAYLLDDMWGAHRSALFVRNTYWINPKTIRLRYSRDVSLEVDNSRINITALGPGLGIDFDDETDWTPTVKSVSLVAGSKCELDVELSAPPTGLRKRILIASRLTGNGGNGCFEGARSGLRSSEPFGKDILDGTDLFDWACQEEIAIA
jgi:hypothetical protein